MNDIRNLERDSERSYPMIALVNLLTAFVALAVCVNGPGLIEAAARLRTAGSLLEAVVGMAGVGALFGAMMGLGHVSLWRSALTCSVAGIVVGLMTLAVCVSPPPIAPAVVGMFLPAVTVGIFRYGSD